jgi:hypothetical protein
MRRNATPAITPKMYRHFAVMTVALTGLTAFFANGENDKAIAAAAATEAPTAVRPAARKAPPPERERAADSESWRDDGDFTFGEPMMRPSAGVAGWGTGAFDPALGRPVGADDPLLADDEETDEASPAPSASQIAAVAAASRLRSGSTGID